MPELVFPQALPKPKPKSTARSCAGHRAWVRRHSCCVRGCRSTSIECAHVGAGSDGAMGVNPSDRWTISLCQLHHREQHQIGERGFEAKYSIDLLGLAVEFARRSPLRFKLS